MISRREFLATTGAAVAASRVGTAVESAPSPGATGEKSAKLLLLEDNLKPATFDRLPLEWHKQRAQKLREKIGASRPGVRTPGAAPGLEQA